MRTLAMLVLVLLLIAPNGVAKPQEEERVQLMFVEKRATFEGAGQLSEGETRSFRFVVMQPNLTRVDFVLEWRETGDDAGVSGPDAFSLTARDPAGRDAGAPQRGVGGRLQLAAADLARVPADQEVPESQVDARRAALASSAGQGEWRALVKLEDVGNPSGMRVDKGNAFTLRAHVTYYEAVPMRIVSLPDAQGHVATQAPPLPWSLALAALASLAGVLALVLGRDRFRRRRQRALSPGGDNTPPPPR